MLRAKMSSLLKYLPGLVLALAILATSWALLNHGFFFTHDMLHLARGAELWRTLSAGQFPPRWSQNFGFGYGIPLFEFYAPLPYFVSGLLYGAHVPDLLNLKLLYLIPNVLSVIGAFLLGKQFAGKKGGLFLAVVFALAPYRAVDLFVRGAISESWGIMTFPWILYGLTLMIHHLKFGKIIFLLACVTLFLSHNITTLLFMPLAISFGLVELLVMASMIQSQRALKLKKFVLTSSQVIGVSLLAVGASAFYLFPAFLEKQYVQIGFSIDDYYHYANHFLYLRQFFTPFWGYGNSVYGPNDTLSFFLGYGWWACLVVGIVTFLIWLVFKIVKKLRVSGAEKATLVRIFGWGILSAISLVMTLEKSAQVWNLISPLQFAQFPWRFLGCFAIFSCLTFLGCLSLISNRKLQCFVIALLITIIVATQVTYFQPTPLIPEDATPYTTSADYIKNTLGLSLLEYLPLSVPPTVKVAEARLRLTANGTVNLTQDRVGNYRAEITSPENSQVIWQVANFPGWKTSLDGQTISWTTSPDGMVMMPVPAGTHVVTLSWGETPIRFVSDLVSAISLVLALALIWNERKLIRKSPINPQEIK